MRHAAVPPSSQVGQTTGQPDLRADGLGCNPLETEYRFMSKFCFDTPGRARLEPDFVI